MKQLKLGTLHFTQARAELIKAELVAYQHPLYQVLALEPKPVKAILKTETKNRTNAQQLLQVKQILNAGGAHD